MTGSRKTAVIVALMLALLAVPTYAIVVYDPFNEIHHLKNLAESVKIYQQAVTTYNRITEQYNHMKYMAQYIKNMPARYKSVLTPWKGVSATNTYGTTAPWLGAVNTGLNATAGWQAATMRLVDYGAALGNIPASQVQRKKMEFATLELQDGVAISAIDTLGRIRQNGPLVESTLANLEADALAADADLQTEAAQLNKANAIALVQTKLAADHNKLLATNAEIALMRLKQERDAAAYAAANDAIYRRDAAIALEAQHADASSSMLAFRLP